MTQDGFRSGTAHPLAAANGVVLMRAGLWVLAWVLFSLMPMRVLGSVYLSDSNYSHGWLLPVVAGVLAWRSRQEWMETDGGGRWPGLLLLLAGALLVVGSHWLHAAVTYGWRGYVFLQGTGWLVATAGWLGVLLGWARWRVLMPRLGFLVFMVPLPDSWLLTLMLALQRVVAISSAALLRMAGMVVCREGDLLHLSSVTLGVAGACSGIRSLMMFFAAATICAVFLRLNIPQTLGLLLLAPVAAVGSNIIRVVATAALANGWGRIWLEGPWHEAVGLGAVLLGGLVLLGTAHALGPPIAVASGGIQWGGHRGGKPGPSCRAELGGMAVLVVSALAMWHLTGHYARLAETVRIAQPARQPLAELPLQIGDCRATGPDDSLKSYEQDMLRPTDHLIRRYADPQGRVIRLTVLYWDPRPVHASTQAPSGTPHSPDLCWRYEGWRMIRKEPSASYDWLPDARIETSLFEKSGRQRLVLFWPSKRGAWDIRAAWSFVEWGKMLIQSWRQMPPGWAMPDYQVRLDMEMEGGFDETRKQGLLFARNITVLFPDYGIGRSASQACPRPGNRI